MSLFSLSDTRICPKFVEFTLRMVDLECIYDRMTRMSNAPTIGSKSILARLMADEGITVMHDAQAQTASFDLKARVLRLPVWQNMTNALYDMLVGHEVAHALWTPQDRWQADIDSIAKSKGLPYAIVQQYANVVEDARIERMIKARFPGIRRDFLAAYVDLMGRDLFDLNGRSLSDLALIDRINLEFKVGLHAGETIPFAADERVWLDRIARTTTWDDVLAVVNDILDAVSESQDDAGDDAEAPAMDSDAEGEGQGDGGDDEDGDESGSSEAPSDGDEGEDESNAAGDDDNDDSPAEGADGESKAVQSVPESLTDSAFNKVTDHLRVEGDDYYYGDMTIERFDLAKTIIPFGSVHRDLSNAWGTERARLDEKTREFIAKSRPVVNVLAKQFEMKKSADAHRRTTIHKSGVLDTVKMMNYKWSEDIFRRHAVVSEGKNHGLVIFLDWSGSMCETIENTVQQMIQLALFCRKVNVPFEVYAFSSTPATAFDSEIKAEKDKSSYHPKGSLSLLNLLSSKMTRQQFDQAILNVACLAKSCSVDYDCRLVCPRNYGMGSTPLNEAIIAALDIVPAFRAETKRQIISTVFLTDGASNGMHIPSKGTIRLEGDSLPTRVNDRRPTEVLLDMLRDRAGSKSVNLFLANWGDNRFTRYAGSYFSHDEASINAAAKTWKSENYAISTSKDGFDEQFLIRVRKVSNDSIEVSDDASNTKKKNAFLKAAGQKTTSRVVLNRFIDIIA